MKRSDITPTAQLGRRAPEAGRIRLGVKTEKAMKSIDTLRFTSPDRTIIEAIAARYGGTAGPWNEPKANPPNQWQVVTTSNEVRVLLIPNGLSTNYEMWSDGGCLRRCDGITCQTPQQVGPDYELIESPCVCRINNLRECNPYTRLQVVLPEFHFIGVWRLETKGWNAAEELPGMFDLLQSCAQRGVMLDAVLSVERRTKVILGKKKNFVVPRLAVRNSVLELAEGGGTLRLMPGQPGPDYTVPALMAAPDDDDLIDAEVIDDELLEIEALLSQDAANFGLDGQSYIDAIKAATSGDRARMRAASRRVRAGEIEPTTITAGKITWRSLTKED